MKILKWASVFIIVLLVCSSCNGAGPKGTSVPNDNKQTNADESKPTVDDSIYAAYYDKYEELAAKYGAGGDYPQLAETTVGQDASCSYLTGICVGDLMDFNGDKVKDLFVVYYNGQCTGKNSYKLPIPQQGSYEIEIWTYVNGQMTQLLHNPQVGSFCSFKAESWDSDDCFITVFENAAGLPVIQLFNDNSNGDSCSYTNIYYSGGAVKQDLLTYSNHTFTMNGRSITEDIWDQNVSGYNTILLCAFLSSSDSSSKDLLDFRGIDYNNTLNQTGQFCDALAKKQPPPGFKAAKGDYISLYLQKIDQINRSRIDSVATEDGSDFPHSYGLYDLDRNGVPELIFETGNCEANFMFDVYTVANGALVHCGQFLGFHTALTTNGATGMVRYSGQMLVYQIEKITLTGTALKVQQIASGEAQEDFPELSEFGLGDYNRQLPLCYGTVPFLLYAYSDGS